MAKLLEGEHRGTYSVIYHGGGQEFLIKGGILSEAEAKDLAELSFSYDWRYVPTLGVAASLYADQKIMEEVTWADLSQWVVRSEKFKREYDQLSNKWMEYYRQYLKENDV